MKTLIILVAISLLGGCMASIPVLGPAVGTVTDDRVVTGMTGAYACAKMAESIGDPSLRRQVQWNCQKGVDARGRQVAANMPNTHCRETISYDNAGNQKSTMTCTSSEGVIRSTDRVRSGLPR
jgi:hypothetical protein